MSSKAGTECVGATGVCAGGASRSKDDACAGSRGSKGGGDSSSNEESVNPGLVATRATKAARALELPVVDEAVAAAAEGVGAEGSGRGSDAALAAGVGADFAQRPDVDAVGDGVNEGEAPARADAPGVSDAVVPE
jgi:hypothetical protein